MFSVLALASAAAAYNATTTVESTAYVTIPCSSGDVVNYGSLTYTATEATTLTVEHCGCTATPSVSAASSTPSLAASSSGPALANGAAAAKVGAVAAGAAAVAYLL